MRKSSDPKYQHLNDDLHVEITAFAPPSEAHARIAYALTEASLHNQITKDIFLRINCITGTQVFDSRFQRRDSARANAGNGTAQQC